MTCSTPADLAKLIPARTTSWTVALFEALKSKGRTCSVINPFGDSRTIPASPYVPLEAPSTCIVQRGDYCSSVMCLLLVVELWITQRSWPGPCPFCDDLGTYLGSNSLSLTPQFSMCPDLCSLLKYFSKGMLVITLMEWA